MVDAAPQSARKKEIIKPQEQVCEVLDDLEQRSLVDSQIVSSAL